MYIKAQARIFGKGAPRVYDSVCSTVPAIIVSLLLSKILTTRFICTDIPLRLYTVQVHVLLYGLQGYY